MPKRWMRHQRRRDSLIGETSSVAVAEKPRQKRSQHHSKKCHGDELCVLAQSGETTFESRSENGCSKIDVESIEKHSNADEPHDPAVE